MNDEERFGNNPKIVDLNAERRKRGLGVRTTLDREREKRETVTNIPTQKSENEFAEEAFSNWLSLIKELPNLHTLATEHPLEEKMSNTIFGNMQKAPTIPLLNMLQRSNRSFWIAEPVMYIHLYNTLQKRGVYHTHTQFGGTHDDKEETFASALPLSSAPNEKTMEVAQDKLSQLTRILPVLQRQVAMGGDQSTADMHTAEYVRLAQMSDRELIQKITRSNEDDWRTFPHRYISIHYILTKQRGLFWEW